MCDTNAAADAGGGRAETTIERSPGCTAGAAAELWRMEGAGHIPSFVVPAWGNAMQPGGTPCSLGERHAAWGNAMIDFLFAHPKP